LRCVMWRSDAAGLKFKLTDGLAVVVSGTVDVYEPRGQYQFYARRIDPRGVGALELAFQQLREKLAKEGLFDPVRKRPLPRFPSRIAVITSTTGAAIRDILQTIRRRYPLVHVLVYGARVQGEGAAAEIADAIRRINHSGMELGGIDVLIVGRGGGSLADLWAFNEEVVARAIHASEIPVVSAVGHEVDFTIADFVADIRAATPTAAAELVVPSLADVVEWIDQRSARLRRSAQRSIDAGLGRLAVIEKSEWFRDPAGWIRHRYQQVDEIGGRVRLAAARLIHAARGRLHRAEVRMSRVRPEALLARRRERLERLGFRLTLAETALVARLGKKLAGIDGRLATATPVRRLREGRREIEHVLGRLERSMDRLTSDSGQFLQSLTKRLEAASPDAILRRGFTITRKRGKVIRKLSAVRPGDKIQTQTSDGEFDSRVLESGQGELFDMDD